MPSAVLYIRIELVHKDNILLGMGPIHIAYR